jgi:hypothetical protein
VAQGEGGAVWSWLYVWCGVFCLLGVTAVLLFYPRTAGLDCMLVPSAPHMDTCIMCVTAANSQYHTPNTIHTKRKTHALLPLAPALDPPPRFVRR